MSTAVGKATNNQLSVPFYISYSCSGKDLGERKHLYNVLWMIALQECIEIPAHIVTGELTLVHRVIDVSQMCILVGYPLATNGLKIAWDGPKDFLFFVYAGAFVPVGSFFTTTEFFWAYGGMHGGGVPALAAVLGLCFFQAFVMKMAMADAKKVKERVA